MLPATGVMMRIELAHQPLVLHLHLLDPSPLLITLLLMSKPVDAMRIMLRNLRHSRLRLRHVLLMMRNMAEMGPRTAMAMQIGGEHQPRTVESQRLTRLRILHDPARRENGHPRGAFAG